jgi:F0F1-type ATP synthase delta subunit
MDNINDQLAITSVYAKALYALAMDADKVADVRAELDELAKLVDADAEFAHFLSSAAVDIERRADSLEKIFRGKLSDLTLNTLQVMNRHGRCGLMKRNVLLDEGAQADEIARKSRW